jgi:hypothetical protein
VLCLVGCRFTRLAQYIVSWRFHLVFVTLLTFPWGFLDIFVTLTVYFVTSLLQLSAVVGSGKYSTVYRATRIETGMPSNVFSHTAVSYKLERADPISKCRLHRIFSVSAILLVARIGYSQCLPFCWSPASNILSVCNPFGRTHRISQCLPFCWSHASSILSVCHSIGRTKAARVAR